MPTLPTARVKIDYTNENSGKVSANLPLPTSSLCKMAGNYFARRSLAIVEKDWVRATRTLPKLRVSRSLSAILDVMLEIF